MRVLWVSHSSSLDGAERCLIEAVRGLARLGVAVDVIVPEDGPLIGELASLTGTTVIQPHPMWISEYGTSSIPRRILSYIRKARQISKIARKLNSDLIVSNSLVIPCGAFAAKLIGIPHVWYIHEFLEEDHKMSFVLGRKLSLRIVDRLSQRVITTSQTVFNKFKNEISQTKMQVVYCACEALVLAAKDLVQYVEKDDDKFYLALIGRKSPGKGQKDAVEALSLLIKKGFSVHLWLVGSNINGYEDELMSLARALDVESKISFIPFTKNPAAYVNAADAVLVTSGNEAFGRVTVEAMKLSRAVIVSDGGAGNELITEEWNGLLYQSGVAASLAEKIEMLYQDKVLKRKIEVNATNWSLSKFNLDNYSTSLAKVFEEARNS